MNDKLKTFAEALKRAAASGSVTLNAALIQQAGMTPPDDFDSSLKAAFRVDESAAGLELSFQPNDVGQVADNRFKVSQVQITQGFLGAAADKTLVTLTFSLPSEPLQVQVACEMQAWKFSDFFTYMTGWSFEQLTVAKPTFVFTTVDTDYPWQSKTVALKTGQNFVATYTVPDLFQPIFDVVEGLGMVPPSLPIFGPIVVDKADNKTILYPDMEIRAPISDAEVEIFYFSAKKPALGFSIRTVESDPGKGEEADERLLALGETPRLDANAGGKDKEYYQTPSIFFTVKVAVEDKKGKSLLFDFQADLIRHGIGFFFSLRQDSKSPAQLTPATVIELMAGRSYFQLVPPQLQQYLSYVGFQGLMISGNAGKKPSLEMLGMSLGSKPGTSLALFSDPTNGQQFTIQSFDMNWSILKPLDSKLRQNLVGFSTTFTLWPDVFRQTSGQPGGLFIVSIDQDLNINGKFNGQVSFDALLREITKDLIGLPEGVEITFSDVVLQLSPSAKTYAFAFTFDGAVDFIQWEGKPLIQFQGTRFQLQASTPTKTSGSGDKGSTVYKGTISGAVGVGPIMVNAFVEYDGTQTPKVWNLKTGLAQPLNLSDLVNQFFSPLSPYELPDFLPGDLSVPSFNVDATIPVKSSTPPPGKQAMVTTAQPKYNISGTVQWNFTKLPFEIDTKADIGLAYDGNQPKGKQFSGSVIGALTLDPQGVNAEMMIGYRFGPASEEPTEYLQPASLPVPLKTTDSNTQLWFQWQGIRASYLSSKKTITFSLKGWTVGKFIQELVRMIGDPYFTLPSPWDLMNKIPLDGLKVVYDIDPKARYKISATYDLPSPINLGFFTLNGLSFKRVEGKVTIAIDGTITIPGMQDQPLFNPKGDGQDVQKMPSVPGRGNALFDLRLLVLGQRVGIYGSREFKSVKDAITALKDVPATSGGSNPVNPASTKPGQPYYNQSNNWLVALDFGLLRAAKNVYTLDAMIVFNDPELYGLRLAFNGEKAKVLAGLAIDILYKKITDDIGVYQIDFSFPAALRNLEFGAFSVTLPNIGIKIYTNGDFFFDFGFPYNMDFSRSFTLQAIILVGPVPVPVLGSAGFYFGKLPSAAVPNLPQTTKGSFGPVIVFGIGLQFGFGKQIDEGILKAGFSVTVFGIIEGVIASWHPYSSPSSALALPGDAYTENTLATSSNGAALQGDYYFLLKGTVGLIGKLYGVVDFAIIKADVSATVKIYAQIVYESYRAIELAASASVSVKVKVKVGLGLFSINISLSFSATVRADATLGSNQMAPWDERALFEKRARRLGYALPSMATVMAQEPATRLGFKPLHLAEGANKPTLTLVPVSQFTVLTPDASSTSLADQQSAFVFLMAMDAPTADGSGNKDASSFQSLCHSYLPWIIDALKNPNAQYTHLATADQSSVTRRELQSIIEKLANTDTPPISASDIIEFLKSGFVIDVVPATTSDNVRAAAVKNSLQNGATLFPPLTGFSLTVPTNDTHTATIQLDSYVTITDGYRDAIAKLFRELAARVEEESGRSAKSLQTVLDDAPESLMQFIFEDYFLLIAREIVKAASDSLEDYAYTLQPNDSLDAICHWANQRGNAIEPEDVALPNLSHALGSGKVLSLEGITYVVQQDDTLSKIATVYSDSGNPTRWKTEAKTLIIANATLSTLIRVGVSLSISTPNGTVTYTTQPGDSFQKIADAVGISLADLAKQTTLQQKAGLLAPSVRMAIPAIAYTTAPNGGDTLASIMNRFALTLDALIDVAANRQITGLFDQTRGATIQIANLQSLYVSDLWDAIVADEKLGQVAGMAARYQMHGMRLPKLKGLELSSKFLYPTDQKDYGLYQLTGQQFPIVDGLTKKTYSITLGKNSSLSWLQFDGSTATTSLDLDLTTQWDQSKILLEYARNTGYMPKPTLSVESPVALTPKAFAVQSYTKWSTSDQAQLETITAPQPAQPVNAASDSTQAQPILWTMPSALLQNIEERQKRLMSRFNVKEALPYLPRFQPQIGTTDPATKATTFKPVSHFTFATRIDFQVKRLAQSDDIAPQNPFANDVVPPDHGNSGSPAVPLAPYNYELIGTGPTDAILLQRLLTAMDSLGDEIISGLFILYPDRGTAATGLVSRGHDEFLSFITQTNLSTETNPPQIMMAMEADAAGNPPRGIANSPNEFVKLMWELSTVRSGGYYLYYQLIEEGSGLPNDLFDDSGVATLSLAITYSRGQSANSAMATNYVNAVLSTGAIDPSRSVMSLVSQSALATTPALADNKTLADIAAFYGIGLGALASLNPSVPLVASREIPIAGVLHQVTPADVASGNVLDRLASYYSKGAKEPLTASAISAFNPGVPTKVYSLFRIPALTYVVNSDANGPSNTLASISAYYSLSLEALGFLAQTVVGLFASGSQLKSDSQNWDAQASLGTGNIGVELTRLDLGTPPNLPANPTPQQKAEFGEKTMYSLYSLLTGSLYGNAFFEQSPEGLSFGPRQSLDPDSTEALRRPESRRALMANADTGEFHYSQGLGFGNFAKDNAAPAPSDPNLPQKRANPYIGVGTVAQVGLRWLDLFGNRTVTPFVTPPASYSGPLNNLPAPVLYGDRLVGLDAWPNVRSHYTYSGTSSAPKLVITFALETKSYQPAEERSHSLNAIGLTGVPVWQQNAQIDANTLRKIYFQLEQNYDGLGIPGLSGRAVSMGLTNTLLNNPDMPLGESEQQTIRDFVSQCLIYVTKRAKGQEGGTAPTASLQISVDLSAIQTRNVFELDLEFTLNRQANLSAPELRGIAKGLEVSTAIRPLTDDASNANNGETPAQSLKAFAQAAEAVFVTNDWQIRIGTGAAQPDQLHSRRSYSVWAVRMGKTPAHGLTYTIQSTPGFYAPEPVAKTLRGGTVEISQYTTGNPFPDGNPVATTFTGVDMNVWAADVFADVDAFLSATYAAPGFILDNLLFAAPEKDGYLPKILDHKKTLAEAVASTVRPILTDTPDDQESLKAAEEKLRQSLLNRLSSATSLTAVTVFGVTNANSNEPQKPGVKTPPRFYGQPQGMVPDRGNGSEEHNFSLSSAKIPLTPEGGSGSSRLAFLFSSKNASEQSYVTLDLSYAMSHLEHDITAISGIDNYEQSSWISFVTGPFVTDISNGTNLPVLLRALPTPPTLTKQTFSPWKSDPEEPPTPKANPTPAELALWNYGFGYTYDQAAQDSVIAKVEFNVATDTFGEMLNQGPDLFQALAQYITVYPAISKDLEAFLRKVNGSSKPDDSDVQNAHYAVAAFESILSQVATAYDAWAKSRAAMMAMSTSTHIIFEFDIVLSPDGPEGSKDQDARVDIIKRSLEPANASVPNPIVLIDPDKYQWEAVTPAPGALASYKYKLKETKKDNTDSYLSYESARLIPERTVSFEKLGLFAMQNAWAQIKVERNKYLVPNVGTTDTFQFSTPNVQFANPLVPLLDYGSYDLQAMEPEPAKLEEYLNRFFLSLLGAAEGQTIQVKLEGALLYRIVEWIKTLPLTRLPIDLLPPTDTVLEPNKALPFVKAVADDITLWLKTEAPVLNSSSQISFDLAVFAGQTTGQAQKMPLLHIRDIYVDANKVKVV